MEAADRAFLAGDQALAIGESYEAFLLMASACLERDGLAPSRPAEIVQAYLDRFGRGGRLYAAYYRWMTDVADYARAASLGQPMHDDRCGRTSVDRARMFWDAADRYLEKTRPQ